MLYSIVTVSIFTCEILSKQIFLIKKLTPKISRLVKIDYRFRLTKTNMSLKTRLRDE